jgi:alkylhydroperoxidase family enzyme
MPRIRVIPPEEATGLLAQEYRAAQRRAGRIWHIVALMSQNPPALRAAMRFYKVLMHEASPLSRSQRELLAVVVSATNGCRY